MNKSLGLCKYIQKILKFQILEEFLSNNPTVKEYISTLVKEETDKLDKLIKEEIDKLVWNKQHQRIQIPNSWE